MKHAHKFERLSDEAIFCACGDIRSASTEARCALPHYPVYYPVPCGRLHYPSWQPYMPYVPPTFYWGTTTGDVTIGTTYVGDPPGSSITYTLEG